MDALISFAAALVSLRLAALLLARFRLRRDAAFAAWAAALVAYAVAAAALAWSSADGWSSASFRVYYAAGALLTAPLLGAGSLLRGGHRWAQPVAIAYSGLALGVALAMPVHGAFTGHAIPEAQAHLDVFPARLLAIVANSLGTLAVVVTALLSFRRRPLGNALILAGVAVAAAGSGLAGLGVARSALFTLVAALLLYAGFVSPARLGRTAHTPALGLIAVLLLVGALLGTAEAAPGLDSSSRARLTRQALTADEGDGPFAVNYWQYLPPASFRGKPPVLIFLHGYGERGAGADPAELDRLLVNGPLLWVMRGHDLCFAPAGRRSCFLLLAPQAYPGHDWFTRRTAVPVVDALIARAAALGGDMSRVYLTGLSMGGIGTWAFAGAPAPDGRTPPGRRLAAILPIAGYGSGAGCTIAANRIAVWAFHGTADTTVDPRGSISAVQDVNACTHPRPRPRALLTLYPGVGHDSWTRTYSPTAHFDLRTGRPGRRGGSIYDWLLRYRRVS